MTLACAYRHLVDTPAPHRVETTVGEDLAKTVVTARMQAGADAAHREARLVPHVDRRAGRGARRPLPPHARPGGRRRRRRRSSSSSASGSTASGSSSDVELRGDEPGQQAMRWNLFQLAQASAQTQEQGIAAKGVTGGGYEGHYFWDTEIYVVPFLAYTNPELARKVLRFRWRQLPTGPPAGGRAEPGRRAVPVADDQRRGGVGLLRRRHRAVPHQRGDRLRPQALPRRQRRHRLPRRRGGRDPRRDGAAVGGPRLLRRQRRGDVPHPRRHRARRVHDRRQRQPVHERDGPVQHALRGACRRPAAGVGRRRLRPPVPAESACRTARRSGGSRASEAMYLPVRRGARHPPAGRQLPRARAVGLRQHAAGQVPAAAALPPARHLPPPGAQAGRRGAGDGAAQRPVLARAEAPQLRLLRPDHDRRLVAVGVRAGDGGGADRLRRARRRATSARRCSSISPTPTATPATASTWRRPAVCGARSPSASPGCSTRGRRCGSRRACRRRGSASRSGCNDTARACSSSSTPTAARCTSSTGLPCRSRAATARRSCTSSPAQSHRIPASCCPTDPVAGRGPTLGP